VELKPERPFSEELDPEVSQGPGPSGDLARLEKHFFDCIRSGATPAASIDLAIRAHSILCLAEMSERLGLTLFFDEPTRTIKTGDGKAIEPLDHGNNAPMST